MKLGCFGICSMLAHPNYIQNKSSKNERWVKAFYVLILVKQLFLLSEFSPWERHLRYWVSKDSG